MSVPEGGVARWRGPALVLAGAVLFSTGGAGIKLLDGWPALAVSGARSLVTALFFAVLLGGRLSVAPGMRRWLAAGALAYCGVVSGFVFGSKLTTAANAILLQSTAPLWIALFAWGILSRRPTRGEFAALGLGGVGMALCIGGSDASAVAGGASGAAARLGDIVSLLSGGCFAALFLLLRHVSRHQPASGPSAGQQIIFYGNLAAACAGIVTVAGQVDVPPISGSPALLGWLLLLWLGVGQLGGGYFLVQRGLRTTAPLTASLLCLVEPVLNPIWVAMLVGEIPARGTVAGGAFVLAACFAATLGSASEGDDS